MNEAPGSVATAPVAEQPTLTTKRLILRPFTLEDAPVVQRLAGVREVADTTLNIPHPYRDGVAEAWIMTHKQLFRVGLLATFALVLGASDELIGAIGLRIEALHSRAELGYWVGVAHWGKGYCTEAGREVLAYGFNVLGLMRIHASHLTRNPASGRVMQKLGMRCEGHLRKHIRKNDVLEDLEIYAILRHEFSGAGR